VSLAGDAVSWESKGTLILRRPTSQVKAQGDPGNMPKVAEIMSKNIVTIEGGATVLFAARLMEEKNVGGLPVADAGNPVGMLTERDLVRRVLARGLDPNKVTVNEVMSSPLVSIPPDAFVEDASDLMVRHKVRRLAVIESGRLVGIVTGTDLARFVSDQGRFLGALTRAYYERL